MDLKYGDILLFRPVSWVGRLITFIDRSPFSHAAVFLEEIDGSKYFIEADWNGVKINTLKEWGNYSVFRTKLKKRPKQDLIAQLGKKYDYNKIWSIFKHYLFKRPLLSNGEDKFICTEFVNYAFYYSIVEKGSATPRTIFEAIS